MSHQEGSALSCYIYDRACMLPILLSLPSHHPQSRNDSRDRATNLRVGGRGDAENGEHTCFT